jgi:integrase
VWPVERDGYWHATGRLHIGNRSIRVRRSLGLSVAAAGTAEAEAACAAYVADLTAQASGKTGRGDPLAVAGHAYLSFPRKRPLGATAIRIVKEVTARFGARRGNEIGQDEWRRFVDGEASDAGFVPGRMTARQAATRERYLNGLLAFLAFARENHGLAALPKFTRDRAARNPNRRARRRVEDLRPELIALLFEHAHIAIRAQLAVAKATGARVSSILYAARLCDLSLAPRRERITFAQSKNGEDVHAALDATAIAVLKDYLAWRGNLHDREGPLFLTPAGKPYAFNGRDGGGQNKTGFRAAKRRAIEALLAQAGRGAAKCESARQFERAAEIRAAAAADAELLGKVTQHWFRHRLATRLVRLDPRAAMEQGGWLDPRSVMAYTHDVPEHRRQLVAALDDTAALLGRKAK